MTYQELKKKHRAELDAFPIAFAFTDKQLAEGLAKLGIDATEAVRIPGGGFIRKTDKQALLDLLDRHKREREQALQDDAFVLEAIEYELSNHEFCITYDPEPALSEVGVSLEDERVQQLYDTAKEKYLATCIAW